MAMASDSRDNCTLCLVGIPITSQRRKLRGSALQVVSEYAASFTEKAMDEVFPSDCCVCRPCYKKLDDIDKMKNKLLLMESDLKQKLKRIGGTSPDNNFVHIIACQ